MSPELLAQYLKVFRDSGAMSAGFEVPLDFPDSVHMCKMSVQFEPRGLDEPSAPSTPMTPGGWKSPQGLDLSQLDQEIE